MLDVQENRAPSIDSRVTPHVRILNGVLDDYTNSPSGIVLLGRIDPATFRFLKVDESYQRRRMERPDIFAALKNGEVPPAIDIGVRGHDYAMDGDDFLISSPAFIIDGQQRIGVAGELADLVPDLGIRLFAMLHFGTTREWEALRFDHLNKNIVSVSPSLHLRNLCTRAERNEAVLTLYGLCHNAPGFALFKKVSWEQRMSRGDLMSASTLAKTVLTLHRRHCASVSAHVDKVAGALQRAAMAISLEAFRRNVITFFAVVDECWPFSAVEYGRRITQIRSSFLWAIARMFAEHEVFWTENGKVLFVSADDKRKLAKFPIGDSQIASLAGSGGQSRNLLYRLLIDHMNSGRRSRRLVAQ